MNALLRRWRRDPAPAVAPRFTAVSRTHVGRVRLVNEDRVLDRSDRGLWVVADGMGGHHAGDVAAGIAVDALDALEGAIDDAAIRVAIAQANTRIIADIGGTDTSGTTIVALAAEGAHARVFWVGDSRAYRFRAGLLTQLTRDHSLVQDLVDAGVLTDAEAGRHPHANVITRALGIGRDVKVDSAHVDLAPGDRLLLCSDGLSRSLDARDLTPDQPIAAQADRLLTNALQRDGSDNASLILIAVS